MAEKSLTTSHLRTPPQDLEAERALLGSILLRPEAMHEVIDTVSIESFYAQKHSMIFSAMFDLFKKNEPIDLVSVSSRLKELKQLESIGGMSYLASLVETVPSSMNVKHYAEIVRRKHTMRLLIEVGVHLNELGFSEEEDLDELLDQAQKKVFEVTNASTHQKFIALSHVLDEAFERFDRLHKSTDELRGVPTGFAELDSRLAGFQKSDLIIIAARPSMGKTSLALDIARNTALRHGKKVGIFSLEMSSQQLVDRLLASEAQVDAWNLRTGKLRTDDEFNRISEALSRLSQANIFIDDQPANNILKMRSVARRLKSEHGLDLLIVDYLQLMAPSTKMKSDSMVQQVTEISRALKQLARELDVPVIALSQLSRAIEQRRGRPQLSDLRDSGSIEQDADVVMFIHSDDRYKEASEKSNIVEIIIAKHRNGPTGTLELFFDNKRATFRSIERHGVEEFERLEKPPAPETKSDETPF
ncbi:MAG: replicative DNA helicase [Patescibacteria group bacterium]